MKLIVKNTIIYGLLTVAGFLLMRYLITIEWLSGFLISLLVILIFVAGAFGLFVTYVVGSSHSDPL